MTRSPWELSFAYGRQLTRSVVRRYPLQPLDALTSIPRWWGSTKHTERTPLGDRVPWITFRAQRYLEEFVEPGMRVFEYGVGGSTAYFLDSGARLVSVDHDPAWVDKVRQACSGDWEVHSVPPSIEDDDSGYRSHIVQGSFRAYVRTIDAYSHFDVVMVDGRARSACLEQAHPHVRPGGLLVLDNSDRDIYRDAAAQIDALGWRREDFFGPGHYNLFFWQTTIWTRPAVRREPRASRQA